MYVNCSRGGVYGVSSSAGLYWRNKAAPRAVTARQPTRTMTIMAGVVSPAMLRVVKECQKRVWCVERMDVNLGQCMAQDLRSDLMSVSAGGKREFWSEGK
jgi:hypothetical protein